MAIHINISMKIESLSEWSIGTMIMGNDEKLHKWKYEVTPDGVLDFIPAMGRLLYRDLRFRMASTSRLITNVRYRVQNIVIEKDMKHIIITLVAVACIAIGVSSTQSKPEKQIEAAKSAVKADSFPYQQTLPDVGMSERPEPKYSSNKKQAGKTRVAVKQHVQDKVTHKDFEVLPLKRVPARVTSPLAHAAMTSQIVSENQNLSSDQIERNVKLLLNYSEGFYPVPYWDNKQYSIGYGTFISKKDCQRMWSAMGLSEQEGKDLAIELHTCGFRKANQICRQWSGKKGTLSLDEGRKIRDKEYNGFLVSIKQQYPNLPELQQKVLAMTVYNTGWAGFIGGKFATSKGWKYFKPSALAEALKKYSWDDPQVHEAYLKLKVPSKGHYVRRLAEANMFHSTAFKDCAVSTAKKLAECMLFHRRHTS